VKEKWKRGPRQHLGTDQRKHVYTGRGHRHQQLGGKHPSRTSGRQAEELNEAEGGKHRYHERPRRGEVVETAGDAMEAHPEREAFML